MLKKFTIVPSEDAEQAMFVAWMKLKGIRYYAIPNGAFKSMREALKFKATGLISGVPDICIPIPSGDYHGLYIELKRKKGGVVSKNQAEWLNFLRAQGYYADIAKGFDEARDIVALYLAFTPRAA